MKSYNRSFTASAMVCFSLLAATPLFAQRPPTEKETQPGVKILSSQALASDDVSRRISDSISSNKAVAALAAHLGKGGYKEQTGPADFFGYEIIHQGKGGRTATTTIILQNYAKADTDEQAALALTTIFEGSPVGQTSGNRAASYAFALLGNFEKPTEYRVDDQNNVVLAHSWWSCFLNTVRTRCARTCISALSTCSSIRTFAGFINCVVRTTGCTGCVLAAMACCTCNCNFFCSWATGCCRN